MEAVDAQKVGPCPKKKKKWSDMKVETKRRIAVHRQSVCTMGRGDAGAQPPWWATCCNNWRIPPEWDNDGGGGGRGYARSMMTQLCHLQALVWKVSKPSAFIIKFIYSSPSCSVPLSCQSSSAPLSSQSCVNMLNLYKHLFNSNASSIQTMAPF